MKDLKTLGYTLLLIFCALVAIYLIFLKPENFSEPDLYNEIVKRGKIKVGIYADAKPFGFMNEKQEICGYDVDLAHYIAQYILKDRDAIELHSVTTSNRMIKVSTGEVDIVIATMTITPQRQEVVDFSIPYDWAGQALLVRANSKITSIADLAGQNIGVVYGTTAEKSMMTLAPNATIVGFKTYRAAYEALKQGKIDAVTSDDTLLSRFSFEDNSVKLLPKRYTKEPYGIAFKKGRSTKQLKAQIDYAIKDLSRKNVIIRLRKKWNL